MLASINDQDDRPIVANRPPLLTRSTSKKADASRIDLAVYEQRVSCCRLQRTSGKTQLARQNVSLTTMLATDVGQEADCTATLVSRDARTS